MALRTRIKAIVWKTLAGRKALGVLILILGVIALFSPIVFGEWIVALLGIALIAAGLVQFVETVRAGNGTTTWVNYGAGVVSIGLGVVVFVSLTAVIGAVLVAVSLFLVIDGGVMILWSSLRLWLELLRKVATKKGSPPCLGGVAAALGGRGGSSEESGFLLHYHPVRGSRRPPLLNKKGSPDAAVATACRFGQDRLISQSLRILPSKMVACA